MNSNSSVNVGGIGFFGLLILLGIMGIGPCAKDCSGCGPTLKQSLEYNCPE